MRKRQGSCSSVSRLILLQDSLEIYPKIMFRLWSSKNPHGVTQCIQHEPIFHYYVWLSYSHICCNNFTMMVCVVEEEVEMEVGIIALLC